MKNVEIMSKILDAIKRVTTDLFEGNIIECRSYIYDCNDPKYADTKAFIFPCKRSDVFGEQVISAELHYEFTPFRIDGDVNYKIFFGIYDHDKKEKIVLLEINNGVFEQYETATVDILEERGLDKFVEDLEHFILDLSISE